MFFELFWHFVLIPSLFKIQGLTKDITVRIRNLIYLFLLGGHWVWASVWFSLSKETIQNIHPLHKKQFGLFVWNVKKNMFGAFGRKKSSTAYHSSPDYVQQPTLLCLAGVWDLRLVIWGWFWGWFRCIFLKAEQTCGNTWGGTDI